MIPTFRIGQDVTVGIKVDSGDPASITGVTARMQRSSSAASFARAQRSQPVTMTVADRPATDDVPAGWNFTLLAAQTAQLSPGVYGIDARHSVGGRQVVLTEATQLIRLTEAVG